MSKPHVHTNNELAEDLAAQIMERLNSKSTEPYPPGTVLIVNCVANGLILPDEWNDSIERVSKAQLDLPFREVFLLEMMMSHTATLYGNRERRRCRDKPSQQP